MNPYFIYDNFSVFCKKINLEIALSAGAIEYADCTSAEG